MKIIYYAIELMQQCLGKQKGQLGATEGDILID